MISTIEVEDRDPLVANFYTFDLTSGNFTCLGHFDKITHEEDTPQSNE
jgi:hypothetical protein